MKDKDIQEVESAMRSEQIDDSKIGKVVEHLANLPQVTRQNQTVEKEWVVLVSDPNGVITGDFVGWALQIGGEVNMMNLAEHLEKVAKDFNASRNGKKSPVKSVGELLEVVPQRFFKPHNIWVKNKEPVLLVKTDNKIKEEKEQEND